MRNTKTTPKTKTVVPSDAERLCAILARIIERIAENQTNSSKARA